MSTADAIAVPLGRRRRSPALGRAGLLALALAAGAIAVFLPYIWSEAWRLAGFHWGLWPDYLWQLLPFLVIGVAGLAGVVRPSVVQPVVLGLLLAMVSGVWHATQDVWASNPVFAWLPGSLLAGVGAVVLIELAGLRSVRISRGFAALCWAAAGAGLLVVGRSLPIEDQPETSTFVILFTSIAIEALPFVLFGAAVSAALEVFVPDRWFDRLADKPLKVQVPAAIASGFAFPVCECGSVPVARRLILRGLHPTAGLAFMLAAPIVNPVVLASTAVAYQGRNPVGMLLARAVLGLLLAVSVSLVVGRRNQERLLRVRDGGGPGHDHEHDHDHDHAVCGAPAARAGRLRRWSDHVASDFFFMGRFVVAGAALAAAAQTVIPTSFYGGLLSAPVVGALVLMFAAFMLSLCSEADAFVALSFVQFPVGAQLAFLVFGPVLDIKLAMLYRATFGRGFVLRLVAVTVPVVLLTTTLVGPLVA